MKIQDHTFVAIEYTLTLDSGEVVDRVGEEVRERVGQIEVDEVLAREPFPRAGVIEHTALNNPEVAILAERANVAPLDTALRIEFGAQAWVNLRHPLIEAADRSFA